MAHLVYLGLLAACALGTAPLELLLGVRVYRRWPRLVAALAPAFALGIAWDTYAVRTGHWSFDSRYIVGAYLGDLPIEEVLFFLVIPTCGLLTLEAVRARRPRWLIGDEEPGARTAEHGPPNTSTGEPDSA